MRFLAALCAMLGVATAIESYKSVKCGRKNQYIVNTVNRFCAKTNLVAPSDYSRAGLKSYNGYIWMAINGNCSPAQWVPSAICKSQFFDMCISGNSLGANYRTYGRNGCQVWELDATKSQHINQYRGQAKEEGTWSLKPVLADDCDSGGGSGVTSNSEKKQGGLKDFLNALGVHRRDDGLYEVVEEAEKKFEDEGY